MSIKKAIITGITGQDGSYLAEFLLEKNYEVHGIKRRASSFNTERIDHLYQDPHESNKNLILHYGDLTDSTNLIRILQEIQPDEIYNLGAQSHVAVSFETPEYTANCDALGTLRILEAIRILGLTNKTKIYQEVQANFMGKFKKNHKKKRLLYPRSPYGVAKLYAYWITVNYREAYNMFACNGILFNHESPRRGETFVTRKVTRGLARIDAGLEKCIYLGNLNSKRDWGHAKDYVRMQWMMLQQDKPDDYVIATGRMVSIRKFIEICAKQLSWNKSKNEPGILWEGYGINEIGRRADNNEIVVRIDPRYFRPTEVDELCGDPGKGFQKLGWIPEITLDQMIEEMISADRNKALEESILIKNGFKLNPPFESPPSN